MVNRRNPNPKDIELPPLNTRAAQKPPTGKLVQPMEHDPNPPKRPRKRRKVNGYKYDWLAIRTAFIEGLKEEGKEEATFYNLKELAERMNVPVVRMREKSSEERWYEQREQYQLRAAKARQTKRILELSGESVDFDSKSLNLAKLGMAMVTARMSEIARDVKDQTRRREEAIQQQLAGNPVDPEDLQTVIDARELNTLALAATQWQQLGQKALGTDVQRMEIQQDIQHNIDVDVEVLSISAELGRDDPERLASFLQAAKRAGLLEEVLTEDPPPYALESAQGGDQTEDITDAELIEEDQQQPEGTS